MFTHQASKYISYLYFQFCIPLNTVNTPRKSGLVNKAKSGNLSTGGGIRHRFNGNTYGHCLYENLFKAKLHTGI